MRGGIIENISILPSMLYYIIMNDIIDNSFFCYIGRDLMVSKIDLDANVEVWIDGMNDLGEELYEGLFEMLPSGKAIKKAISLVSSWRDRSLLKKYEMFIRGVDIGIENQVKLSEYFVTKEDKQEFFNVIIKVLDDVESEEKVSYLVNLTRSLLSNCINLDDYYRMVNCVKTLLIQDIKFLQDNISRKDFRNNPNIDALFLMGLMYQSELAGTQEDEVDKYSFTALAHHLDKYGISFGDEEKYTYGGERKELSLTSHQVKINTANLVYYKEYSQ